MNFSGKFGQPSTIWYPASGYRDSYDGSLSNVGYSSGCWSTSPGNYGAYCLSISITGYVNLLNDSNRANGRSVRCLQE